MQLFSLLPPTQASNQCCKDNPPNRLNRTTTGPTYALYYTKLVTRLFSTYAHQTLHYTLEGITVCTHQILSTKAHFYCIRSGLNKGEMLSLWWGMRHIHSPPNSVQTHTDELPTHMWPFSLLPPTEASNHHCKHNPPNRLLFQTEPQRVLPMHPTTPSSLLDSFLRTHTKFYTTLWAYCPCTPNLEHKGAFVLHT